MPVSVDECLFEGALPHAVYPNPTQKHLNALHSWHIAGISQLIPWNFIGTPRKHMLWSSEEVNLLLRLRRDQKRTWSDVTRLSSDQFSGWSQGSNQVFWSLILKNNGAH